MGRLRKFRDLSASEQYLFVKAFGLVAMIRVGLWLLPFRMVTHWLQRISSSNPESMGQNSANDVGLVVRRVSRYIPGATCLPQALATQVLLLRRGYPAKLRIGVAKDEAGCLQAHAWIESGGQIVVGGADSPSRFTPFPELERENQ